MGISGSGVSSYAYIGVSGFGVSAAGVSNPLSSLDLNFAGSSVLDPRITFSRGSQATLFDSTGALVYAKHNLLTYSQEFDNAAWTKQASVSVSPNTTAAPDGTTTADTVTADSGFGLFQSVTVTIGTRVTQSIYLRAGTATAVMFRDDTGAGRHIVVNPSTGVITSTSGTLIDSGSIAMGSGWFRIYFSYAADTTSVRGLIRPDSAGAGQTFIVWGGQTNFYPMEGGVTSSLSTYYPTVASAYYAPRFDYNPSTLAAQGLLIEEQRTNLYTYSQTIQSGVGNWAIARASTVANAAVGLDGTLTASKLQEDTTTANSHYLYSISPTYTSGTVYTQSVYVKAAGRTQIQMSFPSGAFTTELRVLYDLTAVTATVQTGTPTGTITAVGNGWYRCTITATATTTASANTIIVYLFNGTLNYNGDGTSGVYLWGAQLETGAFPTSYIPTTTTALTRNADVASMTGTNFSSWYNAAAGSLLVQFSIPAQLSSTSLATIGDGTANERMIVNAATNRAGTGWRVVDGGVDQCDINITSSFSAGQSVKTIGAYAVNDFAVCQNGGTVGTDVSGTLPTVNALYIGTNGVSTYTNSYIQRISYYPVRLPDSTLQALTT